ncbi:unnamed protein product [Lepeophtheirus salmonis]|uniref:(salmon louse) hypothetical protein n=1 Tax=Lepeophtheirus salmonis TaxID=72036 RepID=A0A7R8HA39_LEPSM|nr:unnamed protein product [Lepeophtheirus salmonis]CAF2970581.1 unnamed protein product [Lepeophtheirus salmonis]
MVNRSVKIQDRQVNCVAYEILLVNEFLISWQLLVNKRIVYADFPHSHYEEARARLTKFELAHENTQIRRSCKWRNTPNQDGLSLSWLFGRKMREYIPAYTSEYDRIGDYKFKKSIKARQVFNEKSKTNRDDRSISNLKRMGYY